LASALLNALGGAEEFTLLLPPLTLVLIAGAPIGVGDVETAGVAGVTGGALGGSKSAEGAAVAFTRTDRRLIVLSRLAWVP
jgi:hypothetical protein